MSQDSATFKSTTFQIYHIIALPLVEEPLVEEPLENLSFTLVEEPLGIKGQSIERE